MERFDCILSVNVNCNELCPGVMLTTTWLIAALQEQITCNAHLGLIPVSVLSTNFSCCLSQQEYTPSVTAGNIQV